MLTNYIKKNSIIHNLNPLVKIFLTIFMIIISFILPNTLNLLLLSLFSLILAIIGKIFKTFVKTTLFIMLPIFITLLIFHAILNPAATQVIATVWIFSFKIDGLFIGLNYFAKILSFISISYILIFTTNPADLVASLSKIGLPKQLGFVILATIQFIPLIQTQASKIIDAQQARGLNIGGGVVNRIKSYIPIITPLILSSLDQTYERSISLELRAFFSKKKRTYYREVEWKNSDTVFSILFAITIGGLVML